MTNRIAPSTPVSGTYERSEAGSVVETVRLDVDGRHSQMTISGTRRLSLVSRVHWIAELQVDASDSSTWTGAIWFKDGSSTGLPHTELTASVTGSVLTITFRNGGVINRTFAYTFASPFFREVEFEFDEVEGTTAVTEIGTHDHSNRPATMPDEDLSINDSFERAGFRVFNSGGDGTVPLANAGLNGSWSDAEMHDAMQSFWSRFDNRAQWSLWVLFAAIHDDGNSLGGIMFDDIGPNHRQGTAMFNDSFVSNPPFGEPQGDAWVRRMKYWTACHEMGHAFNLAHSWQKALGTPWIPLANEPEVRSFMNYPFNVSGGQSAFFSDFEYRFSDSELLFMRHAPERFVQMGNADWFDNHGFEQPDPCHDEAFKLEARVNRELPVFEFLEPVNIELKLTNLTNSPRLIDDGMLSENVVVVIKKRGGNSRQWVPFAQRCFEHSAVVLEAGHSVYESLFVGSGINGWDLSEPGVYTIQAGMRDEGRTVLSNELTIRIAPPKSYEEELHAQDYFSGEVGRAYAFGGTRFMTTASNALRETTEKFGATRAAIHADVTLARVEVRDYKILAMDDLNTRPIVPAHEAGGRFQLVAADTVAARTGLESSLTIKMSSAAETLGHIEFRKCVDTLSTLCANEEDHAGAAESQRKMHALLSKRNVLPQVLAEIDDECARYERASEGRKTRTSRSMKKDTTRSAKRKASKKKPARKKSSRKKK